MQVPSSLRVAPRWLKHGILLSMPFAQGDIGDRLNKHRLVIESGCWIWTGHINAQGYGIVRDTANRCTKRVHRLAYEFYIGPIAEGLTLDHVCHSHGTCPGGLCIHRRCFNPSHMEPVTREENCARAGRAAGQRASVQAWHGPITYAGVTLSISDWERQLGLPYRLLSKRLLRGMSFDKALTMPAGKYGTRK
jgi:hypothetical protein